MSDVQGTIASDRDMDLTTWQEWVVDTIIKMHDNDCSDNQVRFWFCAEFDRRYGREEQQNQ